MNFKKCMYFVEGSCEEQLINALKADPRCISPGKIKVHNIILEEIPRREVNMIQAGTTVVFVYDTDVDKTDILKKNIKHVREYTSRIKLIHLAQVQNFEDEIVRSTDVKKAQELTKSKSIRDFKSDFCRMKITECRNALERHHIDVSRLWVTKPVGDFTFVEQNGDEIKI